MSILCEYVEDHGTDSCSARKNFPNCRLTSTSAAGLEVADLSTDLAAEICVGRLFKRLLVWPTSRIIREIPYYTNIFLSIIKLRQYSPHMSETSLTSRGGKYTPTLHCPRYVSHCQLESLLVPFPWLCSFLFLSFSFWLCLNHQPTTETLRKLW